MKLGPLKLGQLCLDESIWKWGPTEVSQTGYPRSERLKQNIEILKNSSSVAYSLVN